MGSQSDNLSEDWDRSYERQENHVFWPSDSVVRFVSSRLRKRVGLDSVRDVLPGAKGGKMLDLGCGIGRNLNFGHLMGLEMYGIELSSVAVATARRWMKEAYPGSVAEHVQVGDVRRLPWQDGFFDHALSDSVLDSMAFPIARQGVAEVARTVKPGGYFYFNVVAESDAAGTFFAGERSVTTTHEQGTIQSYFDVAKIDALLDGRFETLSRELHTIANASTGARIERWHVVAKRK